MRFQYDTVIVVLVFQRMDTAIHWINHYSIDKFYQNLLSYPVDSSILEILVHHYRDYSLFIRQILQNPFSNPLQGNLSNAKINMQSLKTKFFWSQLMAVGMIGASGATVQRMSMVYK